MFPFGSFFLCSNIHHLCDSQMTVRLHYDFKLNQNRSHFIHMKNTIQALHVDKMHFMNELLLNNSNDIRSLSYTIYIYIEGTNMQISHSTHTKRQIVMPMWLSDHFGILIICLFCIDYKSRKWKWCTVQEGNGFADSICHVFYLENEHCTSSCMCVLNLESHNSWYEWHLHR